MKLIYTVLLVLVLLVSACAPVQPETASAPDSPAAAEEAASTPSDLLPVDADVRIGQLDNGLTYYIRHNDEPMNRADLWLAINAGSLQEDEDQLGLAHFLEHMLFNGTENFPGMGLVNFLESIGMEFGPDVNARTSFDETVYTIQVPTDDAETLDTAFQVLEDWAGYATLDAEEVDKERGVIVEEWRLRQQTASGRISEQTLPFILGDSRYADRRPIGDMDVVRTAPAETLRRYYEELVPARLDVCDRRGRFRCRCGGGFDPAAFLRPAVTVQSRRHASTMICLNMRIRAIWWWVIRKRQRPGSSLSTSVPPIPSRRCPMHVRI